MKYELDNIYNEDSYKAIKDIPDNSIDLIIIDPPYQLQKRGAAFHNKPDYIDEIENKKLDKDFDYTIFDEVRRIMKKLNIYIFCSRNQLHKVFDKFKNDSVDLLVWHKTNPTVMNGQNLWLPSQELCAYAKKPKAIFNEKCKHAFFEGAPNGNRVHPNQKPIELVQKCIEASSNDSVIDFFGGSGSTLIACEKTNRKCFMMELDPHYCDVILKRWEDYSDKTAKLDGQ